MDWIVNQLFGQLQLIAASLVQIASYVLVGGEPMKFPERDETLPRLLYTIPGKGNAAHAVAFSSDSLYLFVQTSDDTIIFRENTIEGQVVFRHTYPPAAGRFQNDDADGRRALCKTLASSQFAFRSRSDERVLLRLNNGDALAIDRKSTRKPVLLKGAFTNHEASVLFSDDSEFLLIAEQSTNPVAQWNAISGKRKTRTECSFSPSRQLPDLKVLQKADSFEITKNEKKTVWPGQFVDITSSGTYLAAYSWRQGSTFVRTQSEIPKMCYWVLPEGNVELLDTNTAKSLAVFHRPYLVWFPDDQTLATVGRAHENLAEFVSRSDNLELSVHRPSTSGLNSNRRRVTGGGLLLAPDGYTLAVVQESGGFSLWTFRGMTPSELRLESVSRIYATGGAHFSTDGTLFGVIGYWFGNDNDRASGLLVIDTTSGAVHSTIIFAANSPERTCFAFSPDGSCVAMGTKNGEVEVWQLRAD